MYSNALRLGLPVSKYGSCGPSIVDAVLTRGPTLIESCFSVFQALKGKDRSSLGDGRVLEALLSREAVDVFANGAVGFDELRLRDDSRNHRVPW